MTAMLSSPPRPRPPTTEAEEIRARLRHVMRAQRCGGPEDGLPEVTPFLLTGFYLDKTDLDTFRPHLSPRDPEHAAPAEVGRYLNVPVSGVTLFEGQLGLQASRRPPPR